MEDPTRWMLCDIPERPDYYSSAEFDQEFEDDMNRADQLSRSNYEDETTNEDY